MKIEKNSSETTGKDVSWNFLKAWANGTVGRAAVESAGNRPATRKLPALGLEESPER